MLNLPSFEQKHYSVCVTGMLLNINFTFQTLLFEVEQTDTVFGDFPLSLHHLLMCHPFLMRHTGLFKVITSCWLIGFGLQLANGMIRHIKVIISI